MSSTIKRFIGKVKSRRWSESAQSQNKSEEETTAPVNYSDPLEWVRVVDDGQHVHKLISEQPIGGFVKFRGNWNGPIKASKLVCSVPLIKQLIDNAGWARFFTIDTEKSSARLVEALVERWWDTTHTFHLPGGELGFTPLDWAMLTGLSVGVGDVPPCNDDAYTFDVVQSRFFAEITLEDWKSHGIRCSFLKKYFQKEWIDAAMLDPEVAMKVARAFFLYFVGEFLLPNASSVVRCGFLAAFEDLNLVGTHDWGSPTLALLYLSLDSCSRLKLKAFNGPWQVLEYWAYEYTSICTMMSDRTVDSAIHLQNADIRPKIARWNRKNLDQSKTDLIRYNISIARSQLEMRSSASIIWQPYNGSSYENEHDIQRAIILSRHRVIFQYGSQGVWYLGDRCYRQITGVIAIPSNPPTIMSRMKPHEFCNPIDASTLVCRVPQSVYDQYWVKVSVGHIMPNLSHRVNVDFIETASCSDPSAQLPFPAPPSCLPSQYPIQPLPNRPTFYGEPIVEAPLFTGGTMTRNLGQETFEFEPRGDQSYEELYRQCQELSRNNCLLRKFITDEMVLRESVPPIAVSGGRSVSKHRASTSRQTQLSEERAPNIIDYSDVYTLSSLFQNEGRYGSVTKEFECSHAQRLQVFHSLSAPWTSPRGCEVTPSGPSSTCKKRKMDISKDVIDLEEPKGQESKTGKDVISAIVLDSDDEDGTHPDQSIQPLSSNRFRDFQKWLASQMDFKLRKDRLSGVEVNSNHHISLEHGNMLNWDFAIEGPMISSIQFEKVVLKSTTGEQDSPNLEVQRHKVARVEREGEALGFTVNFEKSKRYVKRERKHQARATEVDVGKETNASSSQFQSEGEALTTGDYFPIMGTQNHDSEESEIDELEDLWKDMSVAIEFSKDATPSDLVEEDGSRLAQEDMECSHSFMLEDDLGLVCQVCGIIKKRIETLFDYQWFKGSQSTRTYMPGSRNSSLDGDIADYSGANTSDHFNISSDISIHPRHVKQMKPHQVEGFNFLVKNLLADPPGGCILAHAPGSGKTFMLISFIQGFMARNPHARPLIVLPKGILGTWRKEFERWQVEDIPLYDFYSSKADNRTQQLEILNSWHDNRSILLLGYKQFANIICEGGSNKVTSICQEKLLKVPTLLILDEGHTPRNDSTDMVESLAKVRTPCKVVLSGTLFQNHVAEVFNILKLVRPNFMKSESSRSIKKRILSRVHISSSKRPTKGQFCELVEDTLRNDDNYQRKISVIKELRDMTREVLHYYRGDFLDELPGLVDFTVILNLGGKQKENVKKLGKLDKFKKASLERAIYMHPRLMELRENVSGDKDTSINIGKVDAIIDSINIREGVKAKFFLNLLSMAESSREKLLVFSQYLLPLKFLERLVVHLKGWRSGKEIFVISGDSSPEEREWSMDQFNNSPDAKVFFGSIKACGEGISLVGASRIVILDVHINPSVTRQAIGRAFRPGQEKKVYTYRLVAADFQEEEDHFTSFRKELISKMWFEWNEHFGRKDFELDAIDVGESQDPFFENPALVEDVKALYKR